MDKLENGQVYYRTFRFYDSAAIRLSAFSEPWDDGTGRDMIRITIYHCNPKDVFTKAIGNRLYTEFRNSGWKSPDDIKPLMLTKEIGEGQHPKECFLEFMEQSYFKRITVPTEQDYLICPGKDKIGKKVGNQRVDYEAIQSLIEEFNGEDDMTIVNNN